jgi:hypothetical protein
MKHRQLYAKRRRTRLMLLVGFSWPVLFAAPTASSLDIVVTNGGDAAIGTPQRDAFELAAEFWESSLTDPVTVRLTLRFAPILLSGQPTATRGMATINPRPAFYRPVSEFPDSADAFANLLEADATTAADAVAIANLQSDFALDFVVNTSMAQVYDGNPADSGSHDRFFDDFGGNNVLLNVTPPIARSVGATYDALGFLFDDGVTPDAVVTMNSALVEINGQPAWDFDPSDGIAPLAVDYVGVAMHEIGHTLGFHSGVDGVENLVLGDPRNVLQPECEGSFDGINGISCVHVTPLDLFRFSELSVGLDPTPPFSCPDCGPGVLDQSAGGFPYFSIDGGATAIAPFASGVTLGDGYPANHWTPAVGPYYGVMQGTSSRGMSLTVSTNDLTAMDVIGWDVPEPSGGVALGLLWLAGIASRRARAGGLPRDRAQRRSLPS